MKPSSPVGCPKRRPATGVDLKDIVPRREIALEELTGRTVAVDAYNMLYQFLSIIRQPGGEPLKDHEGRVTSHLSGLLYRTTNLMERGISLAYVFDGKPPSLKAGEVERRRKVKEEASAKYEQAVREGDVEEARVYAQMTSQLKDEMVKDSTRLLDLMGVPHVQAPSEGEAQAAHMVARGSVWASASQDYDSLLFGSTRLVRNLGITGRRKLPRKKEYVEVNPEFVELENALRELGLDRRQLVDVGILIGTDFNPQGVRGIGPKSAVKLIREHGSLEVLLPNLKDAHFPQPIPVLQDIFLKPTVTDDYRLEWRTPDVEGVVSFLCGERDFSEERVRNALERVTAPRAPPKAEKTLESWL